VQDLARAMDAPPPPPGNDLDHPQPPPMSAPGLPRRVPGAQRPDLAPTVVRRPDTTPAPADSAAEEGGSATPLSGPSENEGTGGVFGFLAGYTAATQHSGHPDDGNPDTGADTDHDAFTQED